MTGVMMAAISIPVFADNGGAICYGGGQVVDTSFTDNAGGYDGGSI